MVSWSELNLSIVPGKGWQEVKRVTGSSLVGQIAIRPAIKVRNWLRGGRCFFYCWRPPFVCFVSMLDFWVHVGSQKVPHMLGSGNSFLDATASPAEPFVPDWVTIKGSPFDHPGLCPAANAGQQPCEAFLRQQQGRGRESMKVERVVHTLFME